MSALFRSVTLSAAVAVSGALLIPGCIIVADDSNTLTIENDSDFFLDEIFIAENSDRDWGPNLAPVDGLRPGEVMDVDLDCGVYDLKVVDDTGLSCETFDIDLCLNDQDVFVFRNNTCGIFEAAIKARQEAAKKQGQVVPSENSSELAPTL
jgi:hypothetical protein